MFRLLIPIILLFVSPSLVSAEVKVIVEGDSNVNVVQETNGESTTCINGECTTTGGESKSTVCVNGECFESDDGDIDYTSDDGNTKVKIDNSGSESSVSVKSESKTKTEITTDDSKSSESATSEKENTDKENEEDDKNFVEVIVSGVSSFFNGILSIF